MKRALIAILASVLVLGTGTAVVTYPAVGGVVYHLAMRTEVSMYGLHKAVVNVGDSTLMTYQGGPADAHETVIMIHGYSADKDVWARFAKHFTDHYRVVIVDLPGHGETAFDPALNYSTLSQAERVVRAMDTLGIAKAHLVGNSMGGFIAARIAHDHPKRVASATLMDAAGVISPQPSDMDKQVAKGTNPFDIYNRDDFAHFYAMTMAKAPWVPKMTLDFMADRYMAQRDQLDRILKDFNHVGMLDNQLKDIHVPVLVIWGKQDRLLQVAMAKVWHDGITGSQLIIYDDMGHMPMVEDPARTATDVLNFIARVQP